MENPLTPGAFGLNTFNYSWKFQLCLSSSLTSSFSSAPISGKAGFKSIQTSHFSCTLLDGGSLAYHYSKTYWKYSLSVSHHKRSCQGCFSRPGGKGLLSLSLTFMLLRAVLCRQGFSSSVC